MICCYSILYRLYSSSNIQPQNNLLYSESAEKVGELGTSQIPYRAHQNDQSEM